MSLLPGRLFAGAAKIASARLSFPLTALRVLTEAGVLRPTGPLTLAALGSTLLTWGPGLAGGMHSAALRFPDHVALIDDLGELTYREVDLRANAFADSLARLGVGAGDGVAIMCRNHRGFLDASLGAAKLGADLIFLNTAFAGPQLAGVLDRERPRVLVYDEEFAGLVEHSDAEVLQILAWVDDNPQRRQTVEELVASGSDEVRTAPAEPSRSIILTSGTTGTPKGAARGNANVAAAVALLSRMPLRTQWRCHIAAPLFHTWGWAHLSLAMLLGTSVVVTRRFEPAAMLDLVERYECDSIAVVPVMLQRVLELPLATLEAADLSRVKVVASSGSAISGSLATAWLDRFGENLYNIYGSTEVAWVSIATPADLSSSPTTAGKPPVGTKVRIFDDRGRPLPPGEVGRIFVGNSLLFEGYTGGGSKEQIDGLMSTGDMGRFDERGLLFVEGRDDEMIISGGENVFPQEVEEVLASHPDVIEAAAIGVPDEQFGQRLRAFVVLREGAQSTEAEFQALVRNRLARYKVPREVIFLDELPRNATGKITKRTLGTERED